CLSCGQPARYYRLSFMDTKVVRIQGSCGICGVFVDQMPTSNFGAWIERGGLCITGAEGCEIVRVRVRDISRPNSNVFLSIKGERLSGSLCRISRSALQTKGDITVLFVRRAEFGAVRLPIKNHPLFGLVGLRDVMA